MISVSLDVKKVQKALQDIPKAISSDRILEGVADIVVDGISGDGGIFDNEGIVGSGVESVLWEKSAAAKKENRKTLNKSGTLLRSIHRTDAKDGEVWVGTDAAVETKGNDMFPYGAALQFGTKNMPARPFLAIDKKTR
jgi:phage gpG-like protein